MTGQVGLIAHCDWSVDKKKCWMAVATRHDGDWHLSPPELVGVTHDLFERLGRRSPKGSPIFVGFDFPIGLPKAYGQRTGLDDFSSLLGKLGLGIWADWFDVCERPDQVTIYRPFYPKRSERGSNHKHLLDGLQVSSMDVLLRRCERGTSARNSACSIFWTLGGNQVGKAAISGWKELLRPSGQLAIWPFDGRLKALLGQRPVVVAETYPGDAYRQLGIPRTPIWSKRKQEGRSLAGKFLLDIINRRGHLADEALLEAITVGFSHNADGEDPFDALVGLLAMIEVADGHRPDDCPYDDDTTRWEGWILGHSRSTELDEPQRPVPKPSQRIVTNPVGLSAMNDHGQQLVARVEIYAIDAKQQLLVMRCSNCMNRYGVDETSFAEQRCPTCGGGSPSRPLHILQLLPA